MSKTGIWTKFFSIQQFEQNQTFSSQVESRLERSRTLPVNTRVPVPLDHPYTSPLWGAPVTPSRNNIRLTTADTFTSTLDGNAPGQCFHTRVSRKPVTLGRTVRPLLHSNVLCNFIYIRQKTFFSSMQHDNVIEGLGWYTTCLSASYIEYPSHQHTHTHACQGLRR